MLFRSKLDPSRAPGAASPAPAPGAGQSYQLPGTSPGAPEGGHFGIINPSAPPIQQSEQAVAAAMQFQGTRGYQQDVANGVPAPDALVKWAPLMFYADPSGMSAALAMATAPPPEPKVAPVPSSPQPPSRAREAVEDTLTVGTGFFVTDDGYLVTCEHVVHGATAFRVRVTSGFLPAQLVVESREIDVAVLKIEGAFQALPMAAESRVKLGEIGRASCRERV